MFSHLLRVERSNIIKQSLIISRGFKKNKQSSSNTAKIVKNEQIKASSLRVIYNDPKNSSNNTNSVMDRNKALKLAKELELDLIMVSPEQKPPVCKIQSHGKLVLAAKEKVKKHRQNIKLNSHKEIVVGAGIEIGDLNTKVNKVKSWLDNGNIVRLSVRAKRKDTVSDASALEEMTLKVFDQLQDYVGTIKEDGGTKSSEIAFIMTPATERKVI